MSWPTKLSLIILATIVAMLIVINMDEDYSAEARVFLRNLLRSLF